MYNLHSSKGRHHATTDEVESYLSSHKCYPDLIGSDKHAPEEHSHERKCNPSVTNADFLLVRNPAYLFRLEIHLCAMYDMTIGLNEHIMHVTYAT